MPKGLFLCAVTCTKRHFENKKNAVRPIKGELRRCTTFFQRKTVLDASNGATRTKILSQIAAFLPVDRTNYMFRTSVRNFHRSPLSETDANEKPFVRSLSDCKCTTLQAILASVLRLFLRLLHGNNERLGEIYDFFQKPSLPMLQMQFAPLPTSHTAIVQNFFHYFPHLSANGTATVAGRKCRVLFVKNFVENVNVKFVVANFNYRVQTVLQFHSQRKAVSLLHEAVIFQKRTVYRTSVQHITVIHGKIVPLFL